MTMEGRAEGRHGFCYLGEMLECEAEVKRTVRARVAAAWRKGREDFLIGRQKYPTEE